MRRNQKTNDQFPVKREIMVAVDCNHRLHSQGRGLDSSRTIRRKAGGAQRLSLDPEIGDRRPPAAWVPWPGAGHSAACGVYSLS